MIWMSKIDLDTAYRRLNVHPCWVVTSCSVVVNIAYILSRVLFDVLVGLSKFSTVSEAIFDLIYDLLLDETWDPDTMRVDIWDHLKASLSNSKDNLGKADTLMVEIPKNNYMCGRYIDDGIMFGVDHNDTHVQLTQVGPVVVDDIFQPTGKQFDNKQTEVLLAKKLPMELTLDMTKKVKWKIDTSRF